MVRYLVKQGDAANAVFTRLRACVSGKERCVSQGSARVTQRNGVTKNSVRFFAPDLK